MDTHILLWLMEGQQNQISPKALAALDDADILVSPMVLLEFEYLYEIGRTIFSSQVLQFKLEQELRARICDLPFAKVSQTAINEKWTRDPFDRVIVAQAKTRGITPLITADKRMRKHYPAVLW